MLSSSKLRAEVSLVHYAGRSADTSPAFCETPGNKIITCLDKVVVTYGDIKIFGAERLQKESERTISGPGKRIASRKEDGPIGQQALP